MRVCNIASGSSGNSTYIGTDDTHIIIDAGITMKRIDAGLNCCGLDLNDIDAILVTHEHSDHIKALGTIANRYHKFIYATAGTIYKIRESQCGRNIPDELFVTVSAGKQFKINDIDLMPIRTSHDAAEPVAYRAENSGKSAAVITDLGKYDDYIIENLKNLDFIMVEANHNVEMLKSGPYPEFLKRRILGDRGHLSNENSGRLLSSVLNDDISGIMLAHLSRENNSAEAAYAAVCSEIESSDNAYKPDDFQIMIARPDINSKIIEF